MPEADEAIRNSAKGRAGAQLHGPAQPPPALLTAQAFADGWKSYRTKTQFARKDQVWQISSA